MRKTRLNTVESLLNDDSENETLMVERLFMEEVCTAHFLHQSKNTTLDVSR